MGKYFLMLCSVVFLNGIIEGSTKYQHNPYDYPVVIIKNPAAEQKSKPAAVTLPLHTPSVPDLCLAAVPDPNLKLLCNITQITMLKRMLQLEEENKKLKEKEHACTEAFKNMKKIVDSLIFVARSVDCSVYEKNTQLIKGKSQLQEENSQLQEEKSQLQQEKIQLLQEKSQLQERFLQLHRYLRNGTDTVTRHHQLKSSSSLR